MDARHLRRGARRAPGQLAGAARACRVDGWKLDLVDPVTGSVLSRVGLLEQAEPDPPATATPGRGSAAEVLLDRQGQEPAHPAASEGRRAPKAHGLLGLAALALRELHGALLDLSLLAARPRRRAALKVRTLDVNGNPVLSAVRIQSAIIDRAPTAAYKLDTEIGREDGLFRADLPPGVYVLFAQPINDTTKAAVKRPLQFAAGDDCYCGQSVVIPESRGRCAAASRAPWAS